jgi:nitroreductase
MGNDGIPHYADGNGQGCVGCQHCMAVCPTGALSFGGVNPDELPETGYGDSDEIMSLIRSRRSIRKYKKQDVPPEKLEMIRQMLAYSPTTANLPDLHFSIIGTREKMDAIREATYRNIKESGPTSPLYQFSYDRWLQGEDLIYRNAPSMVVAAVNSRMLGDETLKTVDPIIALSYVDLYAQSLGLGTLWVYAAYQALRSYPDVLRMTEIPEGYQLSFVLLLGIPNVKYQRVVKKEPTSVRIV